MEILCNRKEACKEHLFLNYMIKKLTKRPMVGGWRI